MHVLHRFTEEEVVHRHVCSFLSALISHTPSKDAIAVLGYLTELSLPLLDTSVCVESGDLSKGMTTFIRNNHLQAKAAEFLTAFLVSSIVGCILVRCRVYLTNFASPVFIHTYPSILYSLQLVQLCIIVT